MSSERTCERTNMPMWRITSAVNGNGDDDDESDADGSGHAKCSESGLGANEESTEPIIFTVTASGYQPIDNDDRDDEVELSNCHLVAAAATDKRQCSSTNGDVSNEQHKTGCKLRE